MGSNLPRKVDSLSLVWEGGRRRTMATSSIISSPFPHSSLKLSPPTHQQSLFSSFNQQRKTYKSISLRVQAAKLPAGVPTPKVEPKFIPPFQGFTRTAETWNSRACMIGLIGTFIVELILNKGILELIGFEVGKGIDIPL